MRFDSIKRYSIVVQFRYGFIERNDGEVGEGLFCSCKGEKIGLKSARAIFDSIYLLSVCFLFKVILQ